MLNKWPDFSLIQKIMFASVMGVLVIGVGLFASAYFLSWTLKVSISMPDDLFLLFEYMFQGSENPRTIKRVKIAGYIALAPVLLLAVGILLQRPKIDIHGKARFAKDKEIIQMGLRSPKGLIAGFTGPLPSQHYGKPLNKRGSPVQGGGKVKVAPLGNLNAQNLLIYGGDEHMILFAPTRGGKGVAVVVPNLLNWPDSTVVLDIKKENWELTAGFRKTQGKQDVYLFDPLDKDGHTHCWNPLSSVRRNTDMQVDDLQKIATLFISVSEKDPFFDRSAQNAFVGIAGYLAETDEFPFTFGEIYRQLTLTDKFVSTFKKRIKDREKAGKPLSAQTISALQDFLSKSENTFESVKSTLTAHLGIYANPILDRAMSRSDFDFADLRKKPMSIYVGVSPNNLERLAPVLNLFFQACVDANTDVLPEHDDSLKYKLLMCMDEFAALGEMSVFKKGIPFFAGYGVKVLTVLQTPAQLADIYGREGADSYIENAGVEVIFTPKSIKEAKNLSERLGTFGADATSESKSKMIGGGKGGRSPTISTSTQRRSLMMPQELVQMPQTDALVMIAGYPAVKAKKIRFYAEQAFLERSEIKPPKIPSIRKGGVEKKVESLSAENQTLKADMETMKVALTNLQTLSEIQQANVAAGEPAEIDMTVEEIQDPDKILAERLALSKSSAGEKIKQLKEQNRLATKDGQRELLSAIGIEVAPDMELLTA